MERKLTLGCLGEALYKSFDQDTAGIPSLWTPENPAYSHCGITVLIVQDFFKGTIRTYGLPLEWQEKLGYRGHNVNILPFGRIVDVTKSQFPPEFPYQKLIEGKLGEVVRKNQRAILLKSVFTVGRYYRLLERVMLRLDNTHL